MHKGHAVTDTWAESLCKIRNVKRAFFQINKTDNFYEEELGLTE